MTTSNFEEYEVEEEPDVLNSFLNTHLEEVDESPLATDRI